VRRGVGAGGGLGCGPVEGLRNIGRRRMAKGMRKAHIVVGSHNSDDIIESAESDAQRPLPSWITPHNMIRSQISI
jgi:hypothetical protein